MSLRSELIQTLSIKDFEAFCQDCFPEVSNLFGPDMERTTKLNILFERVNDRNLIELSLSQWRRSQISARMSMHSTIGGYERGLQGGDWSPDPVQRRLLLEGDGRVLDCDRYEQWALLLRLVDHQKHRAVLLPGSRGQGHEYFLLRARTALPRQVPCEAVPVSWRQRPFPRTRRDHLAALSAALGSTEQSLRHDLLARLRLHSLLLLHERIEREYEDESLLRYYTEWLPDLIDGVATPYALLCVQPIEWPRPSLSWRDAGRRRAARALIKHIDHQASSVLPAFVMPDLCDITREHVLKFLELINLREAQRMPFTDHVMDGTRTAEELLQSIARNLPPIEDA